MPVYDLQNPSPLTGDQLRDDAANLLALQYGAPTIEKRECGKKVDVFLTTKDLGKEVKIYVEAKDYGSRLTRANVVNIWADYVGVIEKNRPSKLFLVTRNGLSPDAQKYVQEEIFEMRHMTIWELENETLGLTNYIRTLTTAFDEGGLSSYYVAGRAKQAFYTDDNKNRNTSDQSFSVFNKIQEWIESEDFKPVAILGGYGAGKTSVARQLIAHQAKIALANPHSRRPIMIKLGVLTKYSSLEGMLGGMFTYDFPVYGFNVRHLLEVNKKGRLLIVLDGFDEMKHAMSWADFRAEVAELNKLVQGRAKVILLGRPSAFTSMEEHVHVLRGMRRVGDDWYKLPEWPDFIEFDLEEFSAEERCKFVDGYLHYRIPINAKSDISAQWVQARVVEVNSLADLDSEVFGKPVHAKILTDLASNPQVDLQKFKRGVSRWSLYKAFFSLLGEREMKKEARRPIGEFSRLDFLREIAFWLWSEKGGVTSFSSYDIPEKLLNALQRGNSTEAESLKREYLTGSFLEKKGGDTYFFAHRSFAEFLVAERMVTVAPTPLDHEIYSRLVKDGVLSFLQECPEVDKIKQWKESLSVAKGEIYLEYIAFLANFEGGLEKLASNLPKKSDLAAFLKVLGAEISTSDEIQEKILHSMRTKNNGLFFLLLSYYQILVPALHKKSDFSVSAAQIAAALIERVFQGAEIEETSSHLIIDTEAHVCRNLANSVLPEIKERFGNRFLVFNGLKLIDWQTEQLQMGGLKISSQPPLMLLNMAVQLEIPWADVLKYISSENLPKITEYFRRYNSFRGVFSKDTRSGNPKKKHP